MQQFHVISEFRQNGPRIFDRAFLQVCFQLRQTSHRDIQPSLDDVFLAKTGRTLEGAAKEEEEQAQRGLAMEPA